MRQIISIEGQEPKVSKAGKDYVITHVLLDDGTEAEYYGTDVLVGDGVEVFLHWGKIKCRHKPI